MWMTAMLRTAPQTTLAFAPAPEDLQDIDLHAPVMTSSPPLRDDAESAPGEP